MRRTNTKITFSLLILVSLLAIGGWFGATPVYATTSSGTVSVPPSQTNADLVANPNITSNFECAEVKSKLEGMGGNYPFSSWGYGTLTQFKIDGTPSTNSITYNNVAGAPISGGWITTQRTGNSLTWSSNFGIDFVLVKGGNEGTNVYIYVPSGNGGSGLITPTGQGISHVTFCWDSPVTIKVDKKTSPDSQDDLKFNFQLKIPNYLKNGSPLVETFSLSDNDGIKTFLDLPKGNFGLDELLTSAQDAEWKTSAKCYLKRGGNTTKIIDSNEDETLDLNNLVGGDVVTCEFTNSLPTATVKFKKEKWPSGTALAGWKFTATNTETNEVYESEATNSSGWVILSGLPYGTYVFCEVQQVGWIPHSPSNGCTSPQVLDATTLNGVVETNEIVSAYTDGGETIKVYTFKNKLPGSLKITKVVNWNNIPANESQNFSICIQGPSYAEPNCKQAGYNGGDVQWDNLIPGEYTITEVDPGTNWTVTISADKKIVESGKTATATVTNKHKAGSLKVTKTIDWNGVTPYAQSFDICITGPSYAEANCKSVTQNGQSVQWDNLIPGLYTISETPGSHWTVTITDANETVVDGQITEASVTNTHKQGSLKVTKTVDWKSVPADESKSFEICITGPSFAEKNCKTVGYSGGDVQWDNLLPGEYTVTENDPGTNWKVTITGSLTTVVDGQTATATVKNEHKVPGIEIKKYTNGHDADGANDADVPQIPAGSQVTWTYYVTNTGQVTFTAEQVKVTDSVNGVNPALVSASDVNGDLLLSPGERWTYEFVGVADNLLNPPQGVDGYKVVAGCSENGQSPYGTRATYENVGRVEVFDLTDSDLSHYCNPPAPGIVIEKHTNGHDADGASDADVPQIPAGSAVTWTYYVTNTGNVSFTAAQVNVTDSVANVIPARVTASDSNSDGILSPGERWIYQFVGVADNLLAPPQGIEGYTVVSGCDVNGAIVNGARATYTNMGRVVVPGAQDEDPSHYCNPMNPGIQIKKYTNGEDADLPTGPQIPVGGAVVWTYYVSNIGNVPLSSVDVTDNIAGVDPEYVEGDTNGNSLLDLTEVWLFRATGVATVGQYANIGTTEGTSPTGDKVTDTDPSHYIGVLPAFASLGDRVWHDLNANGVQEDGEPGIANVTVNLLAGNCIDSMGQSTTTNAAGIYGFADLLPGDYCVQFVIPNGFVVSPKDAGGNDALDSDGDSVTGKTQPVTLAAGEHNPTLDLGLYQRASLGDLVWHDLNANGVQDAGEPGIPNVTVNLLAGNCTDSMGQSTTTNANGLYAFTNLMPGDYCVQFVIPTGYQVSPKDAGGNDALDSDGDSVTGKTAPTNLISGENDTTLDMGLYQLAKLGNLVWFDDDEDGEQDAGEAGVPNVEVTLFNCAGEPIGNSVFTDANGHYEFDGLMPGCYYVVFNPQTLPVDHKFTTPNKDGVNDALDSDADANGKTPSVTLKAGDNYVDLDAGIYAEIPTTSEVAELGDYVWFDLNRNGLQDNDEPGVPGVEVRLYKSDGTFVRLTTTDEHGYYLFAELEPGSYYVEFATVQGYTFTQYNVGSNDLAADAMDSDALVPWLLVSIDAGGNEAEYGKPLSYTFHYTNTDAARAATNVVISTTIPTGTSFVADSSDAWNCSQATAGGVCTIALANLPANTSGSFLFTVLLSAQRSDIPSGGLDILANVTQGTVARTEVVTLAGGESNLTVDAGIVSLSAGLTTGTPTDPTNLPEGEQPKQAQYMYLPTLHQEQ